MVWGRDKTCGCRMADCRVRVAGQQPAVAGYCSAGMWLCFDGFIEGCCEWLSVSGCWPTSEHVLVKELSCYMLGIEKGVRCVDVYGVDMLSHVTVGSALCLYHVTSFCCCWSCDGTFSVSMRFCSTEGKYWLAGMELKQGSAILSVIMMFILYCFFW